jgi:hypothetical protein
MALDIGKPRGRPRTGATPTMVRIPPQLMSDLDNWIKAQPGPQLARPEALRRLVTERLAGQAAPVDNELAEVRSRLIVLASKVDQLVAYARELEAQRDAVAARRPTLEVVSPPWRAIRRPPIAPRTAGRRGPGVDPVVRSGGGGPRSRPARSGRGRSRGAPPRGDRRPAQLEANTYARSQMGG